MKDLVKETIKNLEKIKMQREVDHSSLSKYIEDDVIITITNMIDVLKHEYKK